MIARSATGLLESGVGAIVAGVAPSRGTFERVEQVGRVWIAWLDGRPWAESDSARARLDRVRDHGRPAFWSMPRTADHLTVRETWDPGWTGFARRPTRQNPAKIGRFHEYRNSSRPA